MPSSVIRSFSYDRPAQALYVRFNSGELYRYEDVPPGVPEAWLAVLSKGRFFSQRVRDRYRHVHLGRRDEPPEAQPVWPRPSGPASPPPAAATRSAG